MIKKILYILIFILVGFIAFILIRTFTAVNLQPQGDPMPLNAFPEGAAERLSQSITYPTISQEDFYEDTVFEGFHQFLRSSYPVVFGNMDAMMFGNYSLLLKWEGKNDLLEPLLFLGHQDVVPIEEASRDQWEEEPFSGKIDGEFIENIHDNMINQEIVRSLATIAHLMNITTTAEWVCDEQVYQYLNQIIRST